VHRERALAVHAVDDVVVEGGFEARNHLAQRNVLAGRRAPDAQVADVADVAAVRLGLAQVDRKQLVVLPVHADRVALEGASQHLGDVGPRDARNVGLLVGDLRNHHLHALAPVHADSLGAAGVQQDVPRLEGGLAQGVAVRAHELRLDAASALDLVHQPGDPLVVADVHQELDVRRVGLLRVVGQQEAHPARPHQAGHVGHLIEAQQVLLDLGGLGSRLGDVDALGHPHVHHELGPGRVGEEAVVDVAEAVDGCREGGEHHAHRRPAAPDARAHQSPVALVEAAAVRVGDLFPRLRRGYV